jgi:carboxyl-terminal processing protease
MKEFFKKPIRKTLLVIVAASGILASVSFSGNYFEIAKHLDIFATLVKEVNTHYVDQVDASKLVRTGIDAMLKSLDPYTNFISESEIEDYRFMTTGEYGGIGAIIGKTGDYISIMEPYENSPAHNGDLRAGDVIIEIDGKSMKGKQTTDASKLLKGQPDTEVKLVIQRPGTKGNINKNITRKEIKVNNVPYFGMVNENIGYIQFSGFRQNAATEVKTAIDELKKNNPGMSGIIIDVRNNPGGLLNEAVNAVNLFVKKGELVVSTKGKVKEWQKEYKTLFNPVDLDIPVAVLINSNSASASEIVAGSLQDYDRAVVIGERTFGKGLVQTTRPLSYNTQIKITTAKYYIPSGRCIQAIDYGKRDDEGRGQKVADSLLVAFKTKGGRTVYDGNGITPDLETDRIRFADITRSLMANRHIFDYATHYRNIHESIAPANLFAINDNDFEEFVKFLNGKDYAYETATEKALVDLKKKAVDDKYFKAIEKEYSLMTEKLKHDKEEDLRKHKDEVIDLLRQEIVSRYYFQKGRVQASLSTDNDVQKAVKILSSKDKYQNIVKASR